MFTRWCFSLSDSMWGTHRAAIFLICRRSVKIRWTDPWLMSNSWAISSHEYLLSSFSSFATFSTFSPVVADKGLPQRCLLLTVFRPLLNCLTYRMIELYGSTNSEHTSSSAFWISIALLPRLASILIYVTCSSSVSVNAPSTMTIL